MARSARPSPRRPFRARHLAARAGWGLVLPAMLMLPLGATTRAAITSAADAAGFDIVGQTSIGDRGMNSALAVSGACAYVGSRGDGPVAVVDVSNPAAPRPVGELPRRPGSTPRELRAVAAQHELVVLSYAINGGPNLVEVYRWDADCSRPVLAGSHSFGSRTPHEFYLWQDPARASRIVLFVSMFGAVGDGVEVVDISNAAAPRRLGGWTVPAAYGHAPVHSVDVSSDGRTAYVSLWTGGLMVADVADFTTGVAQPALRPLTASGAVVKTSPGDVHSAVPLPGRSMVLITDERYPSQGCPFGEAHVVDVASPAAPRVVSSLAAPENSTAACAAAARGTWTSHNPTLTAHLALVSWYSAGIQVFGLDDPGAPVRLAELRPTGVSPKLRDLELGVTDTMTWSYPVISGGLVYVVDINQGLVVLRYHGPHQDEVSSATLLEGNSNAATAGSSAGPAPSSSSSAAPGSARPAPTSSSNPPLAIVAGTAAALVVLALLVVVVRRHRRGGGS